MSDLCDYLDCQRRHPHRHCVICRRGFMSASDIDPPPVVCGRIHCRARHYWGPEEWAGRARMARARQAAGIELDDLDRDALDRSDP